MSHSRVEEILRTVTAISAALWDTRPELPPRRRHLLRRLVRTGRFDGLVVMLETDDGRIEDAFLIHSRDLSVRVMFATTSNPSGTARRRCRTWVCLTGQPLPFDFTFAEEARFYLDGRHPTPTARIGGESVMLGGAGRGQAIDTPAGGHVVVFATACGTHMQARRVENRG
jgi:hypothetical protein